MYPIQNISLKWVVSTNHVEISFKLVWNLVEHTIDTREEGISIMGLSPSDWLKDADILS